MAMRTKVQEYPGKKRKLPVRLLFGILGAVLVLVLTTLALSPILANTVQIRSGAMSPTISISDTVCVNHLAYLLLPPSRGDIIQFRTSAADETAFQAENPLSIRRIIALPGETVQITDGKVYINGSPLAEDYLSGELAYAGTASSALTLNSDEYFVMADNRSNNSDSRDSTIGPVAGTDIIGKVWLRVHPYQAFGLIS